MITGGPNVASPVARAAPNLRVCDAAVIVLRETDNPAVGWGDTGLLHLIAARASLPSRERAWMTENAVLNALSRQPGVLVAGYTRVNVSGRQRWVRLFSLPKAEP